MAFQKAGVRVLSSTSKFSDNFNQWQSKGPGFEFPVANKTFQRILVDGNSEGWGLPDICGFVSLFACMDVELSQNCTVQQSPLLDLSSDLSSA